MRKIFLLCMILAKASAENSPQVPPFLFDETFPKESVLSESSRKDDVVLTVLYPKDLKKNDALVKVILTNESKNPLNYIYRVGSLVCETELLDASGQVIPVRNEWRKKHVVYSKSLLEDVAKNPGKYSDEDKNAILGSAGLSVKFSTIYRELNGGYGGAWEIPLKEVYGDALSNGRKLTVVWHLADSPSEFTALNNPNDPTQGSHTEQNKFSEGWSILTTIELHPDENPKSEAVPATQNSSKLPEDHASVAHDRQSPTFVQKADKSLSHLWWLLVIPAACFVCLVVRKGIK